MGEALETGDGAVSTQMRALPLTSIQLQLGGQMGLLKLSFGDWVHALPDSLIQLVTPGRALQCSR